MRCVRTEVLPVPAPATTSMGPWTCSMASFWRSSGVKGAGRRVDFETGTAAQHITCAREEKLELFRVGVNLKNAERVAVQIHEIALPAGIRYRKLRQCSDTADLFDGPRCHIKVLDFEGAHKRIGAALWRWRLRWPFQQTAARSAGLDRPVWNGKTLYLAELPSEHLSIKLDSAFRIVGLNFKVNMPVIHDSFLRYSPSMYQES